MVSPTPLCRDDHQTQAKEDSRSPAALEENASQNDMTRNNKQGNTELRCNYIVWSIETERCALSLSLSLSLLLPRRSALLAYEELFQHHPYISRAYPEYLLPSSISEMYSPVMFTVTLVSSVDVLFFAVTLYTP